MSIALNSMQQPAVSESDEARQDPKEWTGPDSTGASLLEVISQLPGWVGDDFEEVLKEVIESRSRF